MICILILALHLSPLNLSVNFAIPYSTLGLSKQRLRGRQSMPLLIVLHNVDYGLELHCSLSSSLSLCHVNQSGPLANCCVNFPIFTS
ncbi:uncharacterized protein BJ212DRAFT_84936 [Suillus subaureus]|uniref:Secreted protein n=1 Tax=Suillus subaureus TaxID=48587 RepID=A0A9P7EE81_9AGAM|nr:uncharacterized protein BJ212DRAFT_84936 [Suillus subaureus]KAG1819296.1 hypothetical protein BJ212DRAFT_84936 [Suillus subaureus]